MLDIELLLQAARADLEERDEHLLAIATARD
jgi:hypothetical protein